MIKTGVYHCAVCVILCNRGSSYPELLSQPGLSAHICLILQVAEIFSFVPQRSGYYRTRQLFVFVLMTIFEDACVGFAGIFCNLLNLLIKCE